jgi:hypothetical protein
MDRPLEVSICITDAPSVMDFQTDHPLFLEMEKEKMKGTMVF